MSATLEALASLVQAQNTQRAQQEAMRRAQQASASQGGQQGGQQGQPGGQQGGPQGAHPGGQSGPHGVQGGQGTGMQALQRQMQDAQRQMSAHELGQQFKQGAHAGQTWQGFAGQTSAVGDQAADAARPDKLYQSLLKDGATPDVRNATGNKVVDPADAAADATRTAPATQAQATTNHGSGPTRNIRGFREVDEQKLKDALPDNAKHLAKSFIESGRKHNIDPIALAGISGHETGNWTSSAFKNKNNAMGISNRKGPIHMPSAEASIERMAKGLADPKGYYKNASSVADIGRIYAPVGANNDPRGLNNHWTRGVSSRIDRLERAVMN